MSVSRTRETDRGLCFSRNCASYFKVGLTNMDNHLETASIQAATIRDSTTLCAVTTQRVTFSIRSMYLSRNKSVESMTTGDNLVKTPKGTRGNGMVF